MGARTWWQWIISVWPMLLWLRHAYTIFVEWFERKSTFLDTHAYITWTVTWGDLGKCKLLYTALYQPVDDWPLTSSLRKLSLGQYGTGKRAPNWSHSWGLNMWHRATSLKVTEIYVGYIDSAICQCAMTWKPRSPHHDDNKHWPAIQPGPCNCEKNTLVATL